MQLGYEGQSSARSAKAHVNGSTSTGQGANIMLQEDMSAQRF
jgi:hypothetical protein